MTDGILSIYFDRSSSNYSDNETFNTVFCSVPERKAQVIASASTILLTTFISSKYQSILQ